MIMSADGPAGGLVGDLSWVLWSVVTGAADHGRIHGIVVALETPWLTQQRKGGLSGLIESAKGTGFPQPASRR